MKPALIFDMDGTLFQTNTILEIALEDTFSHLKSLGLWNSETPIDQYREIMGVPLPVVWQTLLPNYTEEIRILANEVFHERLIHNIECGNGALYPNVEALFKHLSKNEFPIFIASNGIPAYLKAVVNFYHLDRWVIETFSIEQIASLDKGALVGEIIRKYGIKNGAVIGDRLSDINAAKTNHLLAVGCRFDFAQEAELAQADAVIEDLAELKGLLPMILLATKNY